MSWVTIFGPTAVFTHDDKRVLFYHYKTYITQRSHRDTIAWQALDVAFDHAGKLLFTVF